MKTPDISIQETQSLPCIYSSRVVRTLQHPYKEKWIENNSLAYLKTNFAKK